MKTSSKNLAKIIAGVAAALLVILLVLACIAAALIVVNRVRQPQAEGASERSAIPPEAAAHIESKSDLIVVDQPQPLAEVASPLSVVGQARGTWYFEGDFPVRLEDAQGNVLARGIAAAQLDPNDPNATSMTEDFVPFQAELSFSPPATATGTLVLERDNPSGLPENADELRIPVRFASERRN
jgi:hypothetical protein